MTGLHCLEELSLRQLSFTERTFIPPSAWIWPAETGGGKKQPEVAVFCCSAVRGGLQKPTGVAGNEEPAAAISSDIVSGKTLAWFKLAACECNSLLADLAPGDKKKGLRIGLISAWGVFALRKLQRRGLQLYSVPACERLTSNRTRRRSYTAAGWPGRSVVEGQNIETPLQRGTLARRSVNKVAWLQRFKLYCFIHPASRTLMSQCFAVKSTPC